jgi:predicted  nucleic acid-binding Zn-ribbon protein
MLDSLDEESDKINQKIGYLQQEVERLETGKVDDMQEELRLVEETISELSEYIEEMQIEEKVDRSELEERITDLNEQIEAYNNDELEEEVAELEKELADVTDIVKEVAKNSS